MKSQEILSEILCGATLIGYDFSNGFVLKFENEATKITLDPGDAWHFGRLANWLETVAERGRGVQPDEPVKAFELAVLRWSEVPTISKVTLKSSELILQFPECRIVITPTPEDEMGFQVKFEQGEKFGVVTWSFDKPYFSKNGQAARELSI